MSPTFNEHFDNISLNGYEPVSIVELPPTKSERLRSDPTIREPPQIAQAQTTPTFSIQGNLDWKKPASMILALLLGISLAIGHHFYYNWLDGQDVGSIEQQQWSFRYVVGLQRL
jgi:hypothetical protein